jgi:hypothetical protein
MELAIIFILLYESIFLLEIGPKYVKLHVDTGGAKPTASLG